MEFLFICFCVQMESVYQNYASKLGIKLHDIESRAIF